MPDTDRFDKPPPEWRGLLTAAQWRTATGAIGENRLRDLRPLMCELSPQFRTTFVRHLGATDRYRPGFSVLVALARAVDETAEQVCRHRCAGPRTEANPSQEAGHERHH